MTTETGNDDSLYPIAVLIDELRNEDVQVGQIDIFYGIFFAGSHLLGTRHHQIAAQTINQLIQSQTPIVSVGHIARHGWFCMACSEISWRISIMLSNVKYFPASLEFNQETFHHRSRTRR